MAFDVINGATGAVNGVLPTEPPAVTPETTTTEKE